MIEVFRTNILRKRQASRLLRQLTLEFPAYRGTFDLDDADRVLRVISSAGPVDVSRVEAFVRRYDFHCEVLPDD